MNIAEAKFEELYGLPCWKVEWDANLNLSMNFGQPSLHIHEPKELKSSDEKISDSFKYRDVTVRGEWYFWILSGYWKLSIRDFDEVTGATSYKRKSMALARLDGQKLMHVRIDPKTSATEMEFDLGAILSIRRVGLKTDEDIWSLCKPNGYVVSVRADGQYFDDPDDTPSGKNQWKPIVAF
jgi:hypothetical protein